MIIDGVKIADELYKEIAAKVSLLSHTPRMAIITCAPNFETQKYLGLKKRKAEEVGVALTIIEMSADASTEDVIASIVSVSPAVHGVVVQLPLPPHIDREAVLASIAPDKDPDCFSGGHENDLLPPVVGAIDEISKRENIEWEGKKVAIFGHGRLVGEPAAHYATAKGSNVTVLTEDSTNSNIALSEADIIVSGAGQPHLITKDMVKSGVAIFDAGTSEDGGELRGDVHPDVQEVTSFMTPVPGGIGPITIAVLLRNLVNLSVIK